MRSLICLALLVATAAPAAVLEKSRLTPAKVSLVAEKKWLTPGETIQLGLHFIIEPHWHIYWKNSGDSGTPPTVQWQLPTGYKAEAIQWPTPIRIETPPLANYGYDGEALLIVPVQVSESAKPGTTVKLKGRVDWLVCREVCLPGRADVSLSLPMKKESGTASEWSSLFARTQKRIPFSDVRWTVQAVQREAERKIQLDVRGPSPIEGDLQFFPWNDGEIENAAPQRTSGIEGGARLTLTVDPARTSPIPKMQGVLVASKGALAERSVWLEFPVATSVTTAPTKTPATTGVPASILRMLLFAFIGGLILNLMPCVFPVLSIKILGFVEQAGKDTKKLHRHGWAFFIGVVLSFWVLAGTLILLRAAGQRLGWGFQLQSPYFLFGLSSLLFLMALNFLGLFEVGLSMMGIGSHLAARNGYAGSFYSGVLATIVATPCTAPFMGTAVGFALAQPTYIAVATFTALAVGMAIPYLLLTYSPQLLRFLPAPGRWMETFKQGMAFPLFATVAWLVWVFGQQTGMDGVLRLLGAFLFYAFALWLLSRWRIGHAPLVVRVITLLTLAGGVALGIQGARQSRPSPTASATEEGIHWEPYSAKRIAELNEKGTPTFVDFTAAWCVSCQVNEKVVFSSADVRRRFKELGIVMIKADWTNGDQEITDALAVFDRSGIPFYLLYGKTPKAPPKPLPEVLTPGIVLEALDHL
jgi:thiol:disulfide interchange protein